MSTRKFFSSCDVGLCDGYMSRLILHNDLVNRAISADSKLNFYRVSISIRRSNLNHGIGFTRNQFSDNLMWFICGNPFVYHLIILILNYDMCAWKFLICCDIGLADSHMSRLIFHYHLINCSILADCKLNFFCITVSVRSTFLNHGVLFASNQFANDFMWLVCGNPLIHDVTVFVLDDNMSTRKFFSSCDIGLCDSYMSRLIFHYHLINCSIQTDCELNLC